MTRVVYEPRPHFIVQVGEEHHAAGAEIAFVTWEFERAFGGFGVDRGLSEARARDYADELAQFQRHVRVIEVEES